MKVDIELMHRGIISLLLIGGILIPQPLASEGGLIPLSAASANAQEDHVQPEIKLLLSLVWDGTTVEGVGLEALRNFRARFSNIPVTHFISPAYFMPNNPATESNKREIFSLSRPGDFVGVSFAPWRSIVERSGVIFRHGPTFWGNTVSPSMCRIDCGNDVPLNIYSQDEIHKVMATSLSVLKEAGLRDIRGMMVRGWMATPEILATGDSLGVDYDFSMVTPSTIYDKLRPFPIFSWVKGLWPKSDVLSQPGIVSDDLPGMVEVPQALGALDYVSHKQMVQFLDRMLSTPNKGALTYHIVLHAETAHLHLSKLELVLQEVFKRASEGRYRLTMMNLPGMDWNMASAPTVDANPVGRESSRAH